MWSTWDLFLCTDPKLQIPSKTRIRVQGLGLRGLDCAASSSSSVLSTRDYTSVPLNIQHWPFLDRKVPSFGMYRAMPAGDFSMDRVDRRGMGPLCRVMGVASAVYEVYGKILVTPPTNFPRGYPMVMNLRTLLRHFLPHVD